MLRGGWFCFGWGRGGAVFGAQVVDQLLNFFIAQGIAKGGHFFAAVEDVLRDFFGRPCLVVADAGQRGGVFGAFKGNTVAEAAALIAVENGAGFCVLWVVGGEGRCAGEDQEGGEGPETGNHDAIFAWRGRDRRGECGRAAV